MWRPMNRFIVLLADCGAASVLAHFHVRNYYKHSEGHKQNCVLQMFVRVLWQHKYNTVNYKLCMNVFAKATKRWHDERKYAACHRTGGTGHHFVYRPIENFLGCFRQCPALLWASNEMPANLLNNVRKCSSAWVISPCGSQPQITRTAFVWFTA